MADADTFNIPEISKDAVAFTRQVLADQALAQTYLMCASGLTERQAVSVLANALVDISWSFAKTERNAAGETPSPERFLEMVRTHIHSNEDQPDVMP